MLIVISSFLGPTSTPVEMNGGSSVMNAFPFLRVWGLWVGWDRCRLSRRAVGVLAGTPRLNVQSGHSKALNQGSSCAALGPHPAKGRTKVEKTTNLPKFLTWEPSQATLDKDINSWCCMLLRGLRLFGVRQHKRPSVCPLWWKGHRPRVRSRSESPKAPSGVIDFLQTTTQTYLEDPIWDKLQQGKEHTIVFRNCSVTLPGQEQLGGYSVDQVLFAVHVPMNSEAIVPEWAFAGVPRLRHVSVESGIRFIGAEA